MTDENNPVTATKAGLGRAKLLSIIGIVFIPLCLASVMYFYFPQLAPAHSTNEGTFILPPVALSELEVDDLVAEKWTLIFIGDGYCDADCRQSLYMARQIHIAMNKNVNRVRRIYLATGETLQVEFASYLKTRMPKMKVFRADAENLKIRLGSEVGGADLSKLVLLMDPLGNIILYYTPEQVGKPLQKDLKKLLNLSQIG